LIGSPDVVIVGAGVAGAVCARLLARQGVRVAIVDPLPRCAPCFKAEKIEPDQRELLEKFGLMQCLVPLSAQIGEVLAAKDGRVLKRLVLRQNGIRYHDMVNALRDQLPAAVDFRVGRVRDLALSADRQRVRLADGGELDARLVVLASGTTAQLASRSTSGSTWPAPTDGRFPSTRSPTIPRGTRRRSATSRCFRSAA
jgi:2-polyprenyl-6-methoxyphenol hydroxylase-like FAD-dependent oxidoreductase